MQAGVSENRIGDCVGRECTIHVLPVRNYFTGRSGLDECTILIHPCGTIISLKKLPDGGEILPIGTISGKDLLMPGPGIIIQISHRLNLLRAKGIEMDVPNRGPKV